jgi:hypothetical protein
MEGPKLNRRWDRTTAQYSDRTCFLIVRLLFCLRNNDGRVDHGGCATKAGAARPGGAGQWCVGCLGSTRFPICFHIITR